MPDVTASRTLVKSPPELWTECSDAGSLSRHLGVFGEIRITRLEPETAVAWEGEHASGTVRLEPSGWGTKVVLTATPVDGGAAVEPGAAAPEPEPEAAATEPEPESTAVAETAPAAVAEPESTAVAELEPGPDPEPAAAEARDGLFARLFRRLRREAPAAVEPPEERAPAEPVDAPEAAAEPEPPAAAPEPEPELKPDEPAVTPATDPEAALAAALDSLGQAHHRPFSRA